MVTMPLFTDNMWDRSGVLTPDTNIVSLTPISRATNANPFDKLCQNRATELAKLAKNTDKKLFVFWSGGLDSTAVFLLLREVVDRQLLVVVYNEESAIEYPGFLEKNVFGVYETVLLDRFALWKTVTECATKGIIVTGEISDQLFGSMVYLQHSTEELQKHWGSYNNNVFGRSKRINEFVENCPRKIETVAEMLWWFNYAMKYQFVQLRMLVDNEITVLNNNIIHFFDTDLFNDYAVAVDIQDKIPAFDIKKYKMPLRHVIASLSGDTVYAYNKPKVPSLARRYGRMTKNLVSKSIDTNWVRGYR
jgi:hypothetical protein